MSQTDLAKQLDLTAGAIGQWEVGLAGVSTDTLGRLRSVLGVSLDWLICGDETGEISGAPSKHERELSPSSLLLDAALLGQANELGIDASTALNERLRELIGKARAEKWLNENRAALADANAFLARHGLWSDGKRQF